MALDTGPSFRKEKHWELLSVLTAPMGQGDTGAWAFQEMHPYPWLPV